MLVDRALKLAHEKYQNKNLDLVRKILVKNAYPINFIEKYVNERIFIINNCNSKKACDIENRFTIVLPYFKKLYYPIYNPLKPYNIQ